MKEWSKGERRLRNTREDFPSPKAQALFLPAFALPCRRRFAEIETILWPGRTFLDAPWTGPGRKSKTASQYSKTDS